MSHSFSNRFTGLFLAAAMAVLSTTAAGCGAEDGSTPIAGDPSAAGSLASVADIDVGPEPMSFPEGDGHGDKLRNEHPVLWLLAGWALSECAGVRIENNGVTFYCKCCAFIAGGGGGATGTTTVATAREGQLAGDFSTIANQFGAQLEQLMLGEAVRVAQAVARTTRTLTYAIEGKERVANITDTQLPRGGTRRTVTVGGRGVPTTTWTQDGTARPSLTFASPTQPDLLGLRVLREVLASGANVATGGAAGYIYSICIGPLNGGIHVGLCTCAHWYSVTDCSWVL
jgi:hypothetical protein